MTPRIAAIFADEPIDTPVAPVVPDHDADIPADVQVEAIDTTCAMPLEPWTIIPGDEHFNIWIDEEWQQWPEFVPGYHRDFRQPSGLRSLLAPQTVTQRPER